MFGYDMDAFPGRGALEALGAGYISSHYMDAIALVILLIVLFVRPSGIFGSSEAMRLKEF